MNKTSIHHERLFDLSLEAINVLGTPQDVLGPLALAVDKILGHDFSDLPADDEIRRTVLTAGQLMAEAVLSLAAAAKALSTLALLGKGVQGR